MTSAQQIYAEPLQATAGRNHEYSFEILKTITHIFSTTIDLRDKADVNASETISTGGPLWLPGIKIKLEEILKLNANWNSYDASPIDKVLTDKAFLLLSQIENMDVPQPFIAPVSSGGVDIEWNTSERLLSFKIRHEGMRFFFANRKTKVKNGNELSKHSDINELLKLMCDV